MNTLVENVHGALNLHRVLDPDHASLLQLLSTLSGSRNKNRFPGSNPCSLERADFPKLKQQPYFVCEKTNGVRFIVFCCTYNDTKVCAMIDRAMTIYLLPLQAMPTAMFQGSVFDCELAFNKVDRQWQLLVFDAYVVCGVPLFHKPFSQRMGALGRAMTVYTCVNGDPLPIKIKSFWPTHSFSAYRNIEASASTFFDIDGLILTPELSHATIGRHTELFKLKTKHTLDFVVDARGEKGCVFNPDIQTHEAVAQFRCTQQPGAIVECVRAPDGMWDVMCVRTDKTTANDRLTYDKTLLNMREAITYDELEAFFSST